MGTGEGKISVDALIKYFENLIPEGEEDGVSTYHIAQLCRKLKRNMYAYDEDGQCFCSVTEFPSNHYCPIIFYKLHGHMYVINDPKSFRRVAEENKAKLSITQQLQESDKKERDSLKMEFETEVTYGSYEVNEAM